MNIKWEKNSKVNRLAAEGKISYEDILARCKTDEFPPEMATVRIQRLNHKEPWVVVHIRGKSKPQKMWNGNTYECAHTCRVSVGTGSHPTMSSNGDLDEDYDWQDVHDVVTKVREAMNI